MPLKPGGSRAAVSQNVKTEMAAGEGQKQAVAIALSKAREGREAKFRRAVEGACGVRRLRK